MVLPVALSVPLAIWLRVKSLAVATTGPVRPNTDSTVLEARLMGCHLPAEADHPRYCWSVGVLLETGRPCKPVTVVAKPALPTSPVRAGICAAASVPAMPLRFDHSRLSEPSVVATCPEEPPLVHRLNCPLNPDDGAQIPVSCTPFASDRCRHPGALLPPLA